MSSLKIPVEIMPGTSFKTAAVDARELAKNTSAAYVTYSFNGISCSVSPSADQEKMFREYLEINKSKYKFIID
ncbi:MAG: hypothetical protein Tp1111DCM1126091_135 [Prokaryotic dsDNA virus sp.]|nr:MAG: hypothetical protein Tp1111DCM1126091_135 [Prokaryotic dsDNA virus sp.]|tara:strand:+ start:15752 stop:15970 length:219 start_codon:yes stop_codon:yes gene_type:complete